VSVQNEPVKSERYIGDSAVQCITAHTMSNFMARRARIREQIAPIGANGGIFIPVAIRRFYQCCGKVAWGHQIGKARKSQCPIDSELRMRLTNVDSFVLGVMNAG
jgi:hypothetical protein